jgi:site-specific recombinase XerD
MAGRLLGDGVDIRIIQLVLGHSDVKTTQRYLNITDEEFRKTLTGVWERRRQLKAVGE